MKVKKLIKVFLIFLALGVAVGYLLSSFMAHTAQIFAGDWQGVFTLEPLLSQETYALGLIVTVVGVVLWLALGRHEKSANSIMGGKGKGLEETPLENSRFLTDGERDRYFPAFTFDQASRQKKDGVPMRAVLDKKNRFFINIAPGVHSLVIGSTGSGKTTTFINPMIQIIAASAAGSSMIMTDPKGELFSLHSRFLEQRGYDVKLLDLRDTYTSSRWNPLDSIWDMYQSYVEAGRGVQLHRDDPDAPGYQQLKRMDSPESYTRELDWYEYRGQAFSSPSSCFDQVSVTRQKIYDEMYEDLNDLVSVMVPVESKDDPVWEKGARSIVMATLLAMLEDSEDERLGMTRERFNFFNLNKALTNSENEFAALKDYFKGRDPLSQAVTLSRQVLSAADTTLSSYMSITFDKLNMFNDRGLCGLTAATDINPADFAAHPTALFLKIPDEKDTRHGLAAVFILCIYKALIKIASAREDLSLPRNVYFILDEFGNMPKIEKFDKMITVGRSRKIWFNMVVQSYSQLNNVYGEQVADIVKSNCGVKMFIGSNDIGTCKEFSELCGNMTVSTRSVSSSTGDKSGDVNVSSQLQTRPLIYPSELQKLNNKESTGNAVIVTFGNYPLKTKYTPSYLNKYYQIGQMDTAELSSHSFYADRVFYDLNRRNDLVLGTNQE